MNPLRRLRSQINIYIVLFSPKHFTHNKNAVQIINVQDAFEKMRVQNEVSHRTYRGQRSILSVGLSVIHKADGRWGRRVFQSSCPCCYSPVVDFLRVRVWIGEYLWKRPRKFACRAKFPSQAIQTIFPAISRNLSLTERPQSSVGGVPSTLRVNNHLLC